ncbi:hypothetical protein A9Z42_0087570 [Trichoderma parareesei]|uniref:Uncharacterized protein n=1 Tax=Trichoderma parareesei TaxID=858221 RepID=A0A2H2ZI02_TRIPA|nr:hypothetical protein A9Z42_0087570 [Trichoderma parareesei]
MGPSKQIAFVNISHPEEGRSRRVLTSVRRHVMADVGRAKRKRPKWKIVPLEISSRGRSPEDDAAHFDASETPPLARMPPSFQTHLVDPDTHACELINFMTAEADYVYRPFRISWVQIGLSDATAFNLWLAQIVVIRSGVSHEEKAASSEIEYLVNPEANRYYSKSLTQLSHRLSNRQECISSGVIATIMGFICIDTRVGNWDRYSIDAISSVDLIGASMLDRYPRFPIPRRFIISSNMGPDDDAPESLRDLLQKAQEVAPEGKQIYAMLRKIAAVISMVNQNANDALFWTQDAVLVENLGLASHFILSAPKSAEENPQLDHSVFLVQRMVQLACLMIISRLKQLAAFHCADMGPLRERFTSLFHEPRNEIRAELEMLRLWAVVTACSLTDIEAQGPFILEARGNRRWSQR